MRRFAVIKDADESLEALASKQGVGSAEDFDALLGDFWPEDEGADEFVAALRGWRHDAVPEVGAHQAS